MRFILPYPTALSGGHIYNRKVLEGPLTGVASLQPIYVEPDSSPQALVQCLPHDAGGWLLWDSLLLDRIAEVAALSISRRHVLLVHYLPSQDPQLAPARQSLLRSEEDLAARSVEALIATGQGLGEVLRERYPDKPVFLCEPGIDPAFLAVRERRSRVQARSLNLVTVGNLAPGKGHTSILASLQKLTDLEWSWHLAGDPAVDPAFMEEWLAEVEQSGLASRVHFRGPLTQEELAEWFEGMDLFLAASRFESYGMALAEAVAAGLPVLTTRVGEAERLVKDGVNGHVVDIGDRPRFQRLLRRLLEDPKLRESMSRAQPLERVRTWQQTREEIAEAGRAIVGLPCLRPRR